MRKITVSLLLTLLAIMVVILAARLNSPDRKLYPGPIATPTRTEMPVANCKDTETEVKSLLDKANFCQRDSDCVLQTQVDLWCPFGCYNLVNKEANLLEIRKKFEEYTDNKCPQCVYDCDTSPKANDIKCLKNKCIDTRFENQ